MASAGYKSSKQVVKESIDQNGNLKQSPRRWLSQFVGSWITLPANEHEVAGLPGGPVRTHAGRLNELWARWFSNTELGGRFAHWLSRTIALPQLRRLTDEEIPWTRLRKPLSEC